MGRLHMIAQEALDTARALVAGDKGLLAMDESNPTCNKRFARWGPAQTEEARRAHAGLVGRGRPERDPGTRLQQLAAASAQQLLGPPPGAWAGPAPGWNDPGGSSGKSLPLPTAPIFSSWTATATAPTSDPGA